MYTVLSNVIRRLSIYIVTIGAVFLVMVCDYIRTQVPEPEPVEIVQEEFEFQIVSELLDPSEFSLVVAQHSKKTDPGLSYYRNEATKNAVVWFYTHITKSEAVTEAILQNADKYDIPVSLAFSLAYVESGYKIRATNKNTNTTIDRGLFQLNNNSFPHLVEHDFFDVTTNAKYGLSHLRYCLDTSGNEISALAMYNAGATRVRKGATPQVTLNYIGKIMSYRAGLDDLFDRQIPEIARKESVVLLAKSK